MRLPQLFPGVDTEFVAQRAAGQGVGAQGVSRPPATILSGHQQNPQPLAQGMRPRLRLEGGDQFLVRAERQTDRGVVLKGGHPRFLQPRRLHVHRLVLREAAEGGAAPQVEGGPQELRGRPVVTVGGGRPAPRDQLVEQPQIQLAGEHPQDVALMTGGEPVTLRGVIEHPPQPRRVAAYVGPSGRGRPPGPQHLAETVHGDRRVRTQQEDHQNGPRLGPTERDHPARTDDFHVPQGPELHMTQVHGGSPLWSE
ncbi:hypothetical protein AT728_23135 [Streptomyces silvensis]|uniref:Uncharacterized protein n=1 Tax=Streptomyces silvensis TaxID=1765722 RepID=A0A0W7X1R3_9ACTN|nr:hypothetical protein AT728_23135 [Streptomyces silvensis]